MKRTHSSRQMSLSLESQDVVLSGWVLRRRDLGGLIFIDLRDRDGITQIVFDATRSANAHESAKSLGREYVIAVRGDVVKRKAGTENPKLASGQVEIMAKELEILNPCSVYFPFPHLDEEGGSLPNEELRLKYRYLDLRRRKMLENFILRHRLIKSIRDFFDGEGFLEVETPLLIKTTPEGARDYLVPSRLYAGKFYALPQSPQLFKQLLMVAGFEKYFQIARCLRDEDLRADRQPEFTQLDLEMSFITRDDVLSIIERLFHFVLKSVLNLDLSTPFRRLTYLEAMEQYGTDKPDLRFDFKIQDVTEILRGSSFRIFEDVIQVGGAVAGLHLPQLGKEFSRSVTEEITEWVKQQGGKGLVPILWVEGSEKIKSPAAKSLTSAHLDRLQTFLKGQTGDVTLLAGDQRQPLLELLGKLRLYLARRFQWIPPNRFEFAWVVDFPLFQWNEEEKRLDAVHHPFTSCHPEDVDRLEKEPEKVRANAYDIVLNGFEVGGGSVRIHQRPMQEKIFHLLGLSPQESQEKFGFLLEAFQFGAPPHGGIALGIDRIAMLMAGEESIREVIAFPKNQGAQDLMTSAPVDASPKQLKELHLKISES